ncbi:ABC transporter permease [Rhodoluna sp.]|uniref:ABC transporter permease n=1 Tax=Rhodoluna sp. TaxID=1969481 RepID=UPI0025CE6655|nr:ABC transporter permease [Rhodoluna sp.]
MAKKIKQIEKTVEKNENEISLRETEGLSQGQIILRRFVRHRAAMISLFTLLAIIIFTYTASGLHLGSEKSPITTPGWWPHSITEIDVNSAVSNLCENGIPGCPTLDILPAFIDGTGMNIGEHPFGQDSLGTDYLALVTRGAEQSIMVMLVVGLLGVLIGTTIGAIAGFYGGWVDAILMRLTDLFLVTPTLIIGAVIGFRFGNLGVFPLAAMLGLFSWMGLARFVRTEFLTLREREFVDAARVAGASNARIIFKHILPNAIGIIIVAGTLLLSGAILTETALSYLGFGVQSPDVSLGTLISHYQDTFTVSPWLFWWPGFFIISIALCINFIGDGLRDAFDPRQKRRISKKEREQAKAVLKAGV